MGLTEGPFGTILADPPWRFLTRSEKGQGKSASQHYDTMSLDALKDLRVASFAERDSLLLMWATWPMLQDALDLMSAWGFTYKSGGAWAKQSKTGRSWAFGTGYLFRSASEPFLLGTRGRPPLRSRSVRNLIVAPIREHSRKPADQYEMAETVGAGPYLELFARTRRPGWSSWGNEVGKYEEAT